ncbi:dihydroneopterin aldolase [Candidatus Bipolaricaulota bacterium]|nr:dihydroneopterin aldolase [Candidatus Bipolaricaulota bacterium]
MTQRSREQKFDKIKINELSVRCIIGSEDYEREEEQEVLISLTLYGDFSRATRTDDLQYTVDYSELKERIVKIARKSKFQLIEALARKTAEIAVEYEKVEKVKVSVKKPSALRFTDSAEVEITRS